MQLDRELEARRNRQNSGRRPGVSATRIAVATRGGGKVNLHFGHAAEFLVYEVEDDAYRLLGVRKIQAYCNGTAACGEEDGADILKESAELLRDCQLLLCSGIGTFPQEVLRQADIMTVITKDEIGASLLKY